MDWLIKIIKEVIDSRFTGYIQINFVNGTISNVNKHETIRP